MGPFRAIPLSEGRNDYALSTVSQHAFIKSVLHQKLLFGSFFFSRKKERRILRQKLKLSRRDTLRLKTRWPGLLSLLSKQK